MNNSLTPVSRTTIQVAIICYEATFDDDNLEYKNLSYQLMRMIDICATDSPILLDYPSVEFVQRFNQR